MQSNPSLPNQTRSILSRQPWLAILAGLLIVQLILVAVVYWPRGAPVAADTPLLPDVTADDVTELTITDNSGQTLHLIKESDQWVLAETEGFPALETDVTSLLDKITGLHAERLVASTNSSHAQLEVADDNFSRRIDLTLADGKEATLYVGSAPRARATHVRAANQDAVYLASELSSFDANTRIADWINTTYFQVPHEQVVELTLENANGTFKFTQNENGEWQMEGLAEDETFNANNLETLLTSLSGLVMVEPLGKTEKPEYGLDDPAATVTVVTKSEAGEADEAGEPETHVLRIGAQDAESNNYIVASSDSPFFVEMATYTVERFVERGRTDFITVPEVEATPGVTEEPTPSE